MKNTKIVNGVNILQFVNLKEKDKKFGSLQDLIREGLVTDYKFIYTKPTDKENKKYISTRIIKLDLYNGLVTTANGRRYRILNEIDVNPKKGWEFSQSFFFSEVISITNKSYVEIWTLVWYNNCGEKIWDVYFIVT